jgi:hypothetical protein
VPKTLSADLLLLLRELNAIAIDKFSAQSNIKLINVHIEGTALAEVFSNQHTLSKNVYANAQKAIERGLVKLEPYTNH